MRESIGTTWIFGLVIIFILIFSSYLALTISYEKSFKVKNEVISILEREEGLTEGYANNMGAIGLINNYLTNMGYKQKGKCNTDKDHGWFGATTLDSNATLNTGFEFDGKGKYYYCIKKISTCDNPNCLRPKEAYYKVKLFYKFDLPVIGDVVTFDVDGETADIAITADNITTDY